MSEVGPVAELLGHAAWTFQPHDVEGLTNGLRTLLREPARRRAMGVEGRQRAATFTWERAAAQAHALFHELAAVLYDHTLIFPYDIDGDAVLVRCTILFCTVRPRHGYSSPGGLRSLKPH